MPGDTERIVRDAEGNPAPGVFDAQNDRYAYLPGNATGVFFTSPVWGTTGDAASWQNTATAMARLAAMLQALGNPTDASLGSGTANLTQTLKAVLAVLAQDAIFGMKVNPTQLPAGEHHLGAVGGQMAMASVAMLRPANVTAYDALDVIGASPAAGLVFHAVARLAGGSGTIHAAQLLTTQKTNVARYRLHLFNAAPTWIADNLPYLSLYANAASRVGTIDFSAAATENPANSTAAVSQVTSLALPFVCGADANLYGMLETLDGFTPANGQGFTVKLVVAQN